MPARIFNPAPEVDLLLPTLWTSAKAYRNARIKLKASLACHPRALKSQIAIAYPFASPDQLLDAAKAASEAISSTLGVSDVATCAREVRATLKEFEAQIEQYLDALGTDLEKLPITRRKGLVGYRETAPPRRRARAYVRWVAFNMIDPIPNQLEDSWSEEEEE